MPVTLLNKKLLARYEEMTKVLYSEPEESLYLGSFVFDDIDVEPSNSQPKSKKKKKEKTKQIASRDIRTMFGQVTKKKSTKLEKTIRILD